MTGRTVGDFCEGFLFLEEEWKPTVPLYPDYISHTNVQCIVGHAVNYVAKNLFLPYSRERKLSQFDGNKIFVEKTLADFLLVSPLKENFHENLKIHKSFPLYSTLSPMPTVD